jgi:hypothetical protein
LLTVLWLLTIAALFIAVVAVLQARRTSKRLDRVTESYWEVRYEVAQLRARVARLEPPLPDAAPAEDRQGGGSPVNFVPLSTLKRS